MMPYFYLNWSNALSSHFRQFFLKVKFILLDCFQIADTFGLFKGYLWNFVDTLGTVQTHPPFVILIVVFHSRDILLTIEDDVVKEEP